MQSFQEENMYQKANVCGTNVIKIIIEILWYKKITQNCNLNLTTLQFAESIIYVISVLSNVLIKKEEDLSKQPQTLPGYTQLSIIKPTGLLSLPM